MRTLKLTISYDGTNYVGWQVQHNGMTIQQRLEEAWEKVTGEKIRITASGRTDGGVHAYAQVCSLKTESSLEPNVIVKALNAETPYDMAVLSAEEAAENFHAIRDATEKTYVYFVQFGRIQDPLRLRTCWFVPGDVNMEAMKSAAISITGEHDFASFQTKGAKRTTTVRTVKRILIERHDIRGIPGLKMSVTANGFLYNMVRNIVGTLIHVGKGRKDPKWVEWVRDQKDRTHAGQTAPAHALFLDHVVYGESK